MNSLPCIMICRAARKQSRPGRLPWPVWLALFLLLSPALAAAESLRILMFGNSYSDGTWSQIQAFLNADTNYSVIITRNTPDGYQLFHHYQDATSMGLLTNQGPWDYVILQDQSYTPSHGWLYGGNWWNTYITGIDGLTHVAKSQGAKVIYFETWARAAGETGVLATDYGGDPAFMQTNLTAAYVAKGVYWGVKVAPVGEAWKHSLARNPELTLHQADLSHMNTRGAYLTAAVFYEVITRKSSLGVNYTGGLPASEALTLRQNLATLPAQPALAVDPALAANQMFATTTMAAAGSALGTVIATPYVPPANMQVRDRNPRICQWEIRSGNSSGAFTLNPTDGTLAVSGPPPPGTNTLTVQVKDSNNWLARGDVKVVVNLPAASVSVTNSLLRITLPDTLTRTFSLEGTDDLKHWTNFASATAFGGVAEFLVCGGSHD